MTVSSESIIGHIMSLKEQLFELDRERERSITELRSVAHGLQIEIVSLLAKIRALKLVTDRFEERDLAGLTAALSSISERLNLLERTASEFETAGKSKTDGKKRRHELFIEVLKLLGTGAAGALIIKMAAKLLAIEL
jgi:hypothetical protein